MASWGDPVDMFTWQWGGPAPRPPAREDHARECDYLSAVQTYLHNRRYFTDWTWRAVPAP